MFAALVKLFRNVFRWVVHLVRNGASDASTRQTLRSLFVFFLVPWILLSLVWSLLTGIWFELNFNAPWTSTDYPALCSDDRTGSLFPWMTEAYPALRNPSSNIRLLHIHPSSDFWGIEATLESHSFLERPQYIALSYTWGDSGKTRPITVNGKRMNVTENLWDALFHIRDSQKRVALWVDAICIDQTSNEEKSVQVLLMSFIYSRANEVIVWLGDHKGPRWVEQARLSDFQGEWAVGKATEYWAVTKYWLYVLTQEEYWKRCWIAQEIAMASRIRVLAGRSSIPWRDFISLMKLYESKAPLDSVAVEKVMRLESLREAKYVDGNAYALHRLLENFGDCFCTITLDRIFAFVGMASDCLDGCITVDYSKPPLAIYQDLVKHWNSRCLRTSFDAIGTTRFAALIRSVLLRRSILVPKFLNPPRITENTESIAYFVCGDDRAEYCNLLPTLKSLLSWIDLAKLLFEKGVALLFQSRTESKSVWSASVAESTQMWTPRNSIQFEANQQLIRVRGAVTGIICDLGPIYREFVEGPQVPTRWGARLSSIWGLACNSTSMTSAKAINERLKMLLGPAADYRMRNFVSLDNDTPYSFYSSRLFIGFGPNREVLMGLTPWETKRADLLVQFWNTDAVLVVRTMGEGKEPMLVGRAGIVKDGDVMDWDKPMQRSFFEVPYEGVFDHLISLSVLTRLTLDTVRLPETQYGWLEDHWDHSKETWASHDSEITDIEAFRSLKSYEDDWDEDSIPHIDEMHAGDLRQACFSEPCQLYSSRKTPGLSPGGFLNLGE